MDVRFFHSIEAIDPATWNGLLSSDTPFLRHEYLHALEASGSVSPRTGWRPQHVLISDNGVPVACAPLYEKTHSYGEYVFDWGWAEAYLRSGMDYYPKLVTGIPFTPCPGPRIAIAPQADSVKVLGSLIEAVQTLARERDASGWHVLFPQPQVSDQLQVLGLPQRLGTQFHWFNRDYRDFDDFLDRFSSRKRKNTRKERQRVEQQGLHVQWCHGADISTSLWQQFFELYHLTYFKRSGRQGYLHADFFRRVGETLPQHTSLALAKHGEELIGAALYFHDSTTLYGRYWGCYREFDCLHFEACYYAGIEYAIAQGLQRFDPGAQGEHKIQRGFEPILTHSNHWLEHPGFFQGMQDFVQREGEMVREYRQEASGLLPFKQPS